MLLNFTTGTIEGLPGAGGGGPLGPTGGPIAWTEGRDARLKEVLTRLPNELTTAHGALRLPPFGVKACEA